MITERALIEHCSLTLSSLKTASLFTVTFEDAQELALDVSFWNSRFYQSGVTLKLLKVDERSALVYMYRQDMLESDMKDAKASYILSQFGYESLNVDTAMERLSERLSAASEFPHEIGLFLGYPADDVEGFICNKGQNCNFCRYWKVYGDVDEAQLTFAKYDKCKAVYKKLWQEGQDILRLTVKKRSVA